MVLPGIRRLTPAAGLLVGLLASPDAAGEPVNGFYLGTGYQNTPTVTWDPRGIDNAPPLDPRRAWLSELNLFVGLEGGRDETWGGGLALGMPITFGNIEPQVGLYVEPFVSFQMVDSWLRLRPAVRGGLKRATAQERDIQVELASHYFAELRADVVLLADRWSLSFGGGVNHDARPVVGLSVAYMLETRVQYQETPRRVEPTPVPHERPSVERWYYQPQPEQPPASGHVAPSERRYQDGNEPPRQRLTDEQKLLLVVAACSVQVWAMNECAEHSGAAACSVLQQWMSGRSEIDPVEVAKALAKDYAAKQSELVELMFTFQDFKACFESYGLLRAE